MCKCNINLKDLINIITYDGLFDYVSLINYPAIEQSIRSVPEHLNYCYITNEHILYTTNGWIDECKRVKELDNKSVEFKKEYSYRKSIEAIDKRELLKKFQQAILQGNVEEALKIKQQLG